MMRKMQSHNSEMVHQCIELKARAKLEWVNKNARRKIWEKCNEKLLYLQMNDEELLFFPFVAYTKATNASQAHEKLSITIRV